MYSRWAVGRSRHFGLFYSLSHFFEWDIVMALGGLLLKQIALSPFCALLECCRFVIQSVSFICMVDDGDWFVPLTHFDISTFDCILLICVWMRVCVSVFWFHMSFMARSFVSLPRWPASIFVVDRVASGNVYALQLGGDGCERGEPFWFSENVQRRDTHNLVNVCTVHRRRSTSTTTVSWMLLLSLHWEWARKRRSSMLPLHCFGM